MVKAEKENYKILWPPRYRYCVSITAVLPPTMLDYVLYTYTHVFEHNQQPTRNVATAPDKILFGCVKNVIVKFDRCRCNICNSGHRGLLIG